MDTLTSIKWYLEVFSPKTRKALNLLSKERWLKNSLWYLAGGTALALQVGHRRSFDLDFFLPNDDFRLTSVLKHFKSPNWKTNIAKEGTIYGEFFDIKISFIAYPFFIFKHKPIWYENIRILTPRDIAVMKIIAISQRGRKRDFFDLYWCVKNLEPLKQLVQRLKIQYPTVAHNYYHILKSLAYFADAEADPMPKIFFDATWNGVKKFFQKEAVALTKKLVLK
jgi:hypothetical protein